MKIEAVVAIDPGSAKCGVAVVRSDKVALWQSVVLKEALVNAVKGLIEMYEPTALVLGSGTGSRPILATLRSAELATPLLLVPEAYTTLLARERYVNTHPPKGWQRLLPRSLRTPPVPLDDYVAIILGERYWDGIGMGEGEQF